MRWASPDSFCRGQGNKPRQLFLPQCTLSWEQGGWHAACEKAFSAGRQEDKKHARRTRAVRLCVTATTTLAFNPPVVGRLWGWRGEASAGELRVESVVPFPLRGDLVL